MTSKPTKRAIALAQIKRAVSLHTVEHDHICAITLAGAAEEILGKMLEKKGIANSFEENAAFDERLWNKLSKMAPSKAGLSKPSSKEIKKGLNRLRNELKHNDAGRNIKVEAIYDYEAEEIILRAIKNYWKLYGTLPNDIALREWVEYVTF